VTPHEIIGLDLSLTRTGIAMVDGCESVKPAVRGFERLRFLRDEVLCAAGNRTTVAIIEGYSRGSSQKREEMGELGGIVRLALHERGVRIIDVTPLSVKKFAVGDLKQNHRDKDAVFERARDTLPWDVANHDEADACWLRVIGLHLFGLSGTELTPWRAEVLEQLSTAARGRAA
jgi:Holliday junction resolvasome RuvABC endonuclease subunit